MIVLRSSYERDSRLKKNREIYKIMKLPIISPLNQEKIQQILETRAKEVLKPFSGKTILLLDDESITAQVTQAIARKIIPKENMTIKKVRNGWEQNLLSITGYDLILIPKDEEDCKEGFFEGLHFHAQLTKKNEDHIKTLLEKISKKEVLAYAKTL